MNDSNTKLHILVVDGDRDNRELVRKALDSIGVDCTTCATNNESITSFRRNNYDGVILDGREDTCSSFITAAQACNKSDVPIIFFSGKDKEYYKSLEEQGYFVLDSSRLSGTLQAFVNLIENKKHKQGQLLTQGLHNVRYSSA